MFSLNIDYSANYKRDCNALLQAWDAFIHNVKRVGLEAWLDKLAVNRSRFEKRNLTGARYKLHRLSKEAGLPCLSWGEPCPCCINNSFKAPKEAYLLTELFWRARISEEMREGLLLCNPFTSAPSARFPMALLCHRVSLVVLFHETKNICH